MRPVFADDHHSHTYSLIKQEMQQLYFLCYDYSTTKTVVLLLVLSVAKVFQIDCLSNNQHLRTRDDSILNKSRNPVANLFNGHNGYVTKVFKFSQYL